MANKRNRHDDRDLATGQYRKTPPCHCCGKPVGNDYLTDNEVCDGSDGPGFLLCERKRCEAKRADLDIEQRRALYTAQCLINGQIS